MNQAFTSISNFEEGQDKIALLCPEFSERITALMTLDQKVPLAVEHAIEVVARCAKSDMLLYNYCSVHYRPLCKRCIERIILFTE